MVYAYMHMGYNNSIYLILLFIMNYINFSLYLSGAGNSKYGYLWGGFLSFINKI